ncbi:M23 family metallopeptidase [Occallatibacter riparius]|uniref:M23 family metallopeptidase n=1 Tax=Occallatibacter riparius TaxID=1002689 RepID=A0A9J7BS94_9BACT|nr:M23 family metallopeptidase [Occallatibacter riparius]UWZ85449.1 M23 family metallopeptidase [Occallatibacter riparius]
MTGSRAFRWMLALALPPVTLSAQREVPSSVTVTPAVVAAGSPELIRVTAPDATSVDGEWLTRKIQFFQHGTERFALAGVDVEAPLGPSTLHITAHVNGRPVDLTQMVDIHAAHYRTGTLTVESKFVAPPPEVQKEIEEEIKLKAKVFASSAIVPLWEGDFHAPVPAQATDSFGTRRMFNGKLASIHKGADFHAATGTPVHASNSGIVVLARPLYFEGNCVIIDHGLGLFTLSMHFSRIDVKEGQHVNTGDLLGLSGATGRVTGPHLHWAVRWENAYLDPVKLLHLNLNLNAPDAGPQSASHSSHKTRKQR